MERLLILGTGCGITIDCYGLSALLENDNGEFLFFDWILHEAMCLEKEENIIKPHEKNHSTVKDVAIIMNKLNIKNLLLWHCIDNNIRMRKELFTEEAKKYFSGNVYVPNDLDEIIL